MEREVWNSKIGFLLAATGSAMGLETSGVFPTLQEQMVVQLLF